MDVNEFDHVHGRDCGWKANWRVDQSDGMIRDVEDAAACGVRGWYPDELPSNHPDYKTRMPKPW